MELRSDDLVRPVQRQENGIDVNAVPAERQRALQAIERCLSFLRNCHPTDIQLSDLADAVDALRAKTYRVAVALAGAVLAPRRAEPVALRPARMARTFSEIERDFLMLRAADGSTAADRSIGERAAGNSAGKAPGF